MPLQINVNHQLKILYDAYFVGISSVLPQTLIKSYINVCNNRLYIDGVTYDLRHPVHVIGFGKAVLGMMTALQKCLQKDDGKSFIKTAILSIPKGIQNSYDLGMTSFNANTVKIFEGAKDNIPDNDSFIAAKYILKHISTLTKEETLLVFISGGGSALLPYPINGITLDEKASIIKYLSRAGATIQELNAVRKILSRTKGGRLLHETKANIVAFILSDVINDPLDIIASGPTVPSNNDLIIPSEIFKKYDLSLSSSIYNAVHEYKPTYVMSANVHNVLIGSNITALKIISKWLQDNANGSSIIFTSALEGDCRVIAKNIASLTLKLTSYKEDNIPSDSDLAALCVEPSSFSYIKNMLKLFMQKKKSYSLVFGGESVVKVTGSGVGGRNQEMVLSFSLELEKSMKNSDFKGGIYFLSAGTDGIDGPTDVAGATSYWISLNDGSLFTQVRDAADSGLDAEAFLKANNSYNYFKKFDNGKYFVKPGHTGTNVMDIHILWIIPQID